MQKWIITLVIPLAAWFLIVDQRKSEPLSPPANEQRDGIAVIMTGAAARISQETALLEELYNRGQLSNVVFISGVSSGALNAVMLNGILQGRITWDEYKDILFNLNDSDIFISGNNRKLPVNTSPARSLFTEITEGKLGYHKIGDLPFMTVISVTDLKALDLKKKVYRLCSRKINEETDTLLSLVDIMMASSSVPIAFPPVNIQHVKTIPDVEYVDGGVGEDFVPFHGLLQFEKFRGRGVEKVYIISKKSDDLSDINEQLKVLDPEKNAIRLEKLGLKFDFILKRKMGKGLESFAKLAPDLVDISYVWVPDFDENFLMFNFNEMQKQYDITMQWAASHDPVPLEDFLTEKNVR